jgi:hypothetical protein
MLNAHEARVPDSGILQLLQNYPSKEQHLTNREDPSWYEEQQKKKEKKPLLVGLPHLAEAGSFI